ncbi:MAG: bifunctional methylenetetrahydrofolate dehydrogenase/methenyltetrahydrofolate cyclohydrolase FolD [Candidatus Methanomethylophilus sp.]|nr:bifunctional methylenetetrahydrofolate dehydrogenase/methenyltetrahydrofolate cyclohydrolase FolD [Methanomethylophilus sp.]
MAADLILGKDVSEKIYADVREKIASLKQKGIVPGLAVILVGDDPASQIYVGMKDKMCRELGINSYQFLLPAETTQEELMAKIRELNADDRISGILVQLPLPRHLDESAVIKAIDPDKDVDCFHPFNLGKMVIGEADLLPATPAGIHQMMVRSGIKIAGKHVVIVGRSNIVGKPLANILMQKDENADATVTVVHSRSANFTELTKQADILIVAIGKPRFITADMVKEGAVIIDVGTNRIDDPTAKNGKRLVGDVDFDSVKDKVSAITPVPGGVGPMTICMLMSNTVTAAERRLTQ